MSDPGVRPVGTEWGWGWEFGCKAAEVRSGERRRLGEGMAGSARAWAGQPPAPPGPAWRLPNDFQWSRRSRDSYLTSCFLFLEVPVLRFCSFSTFPPHPKMTAL